jgi:hypothetical protein
VEQRAIVESTYNGGNCVHELEMLIAPYRLETGVEHQEQSQKIGCKIERRDFAELATSRRMIGL